jgi:hypothetical protein
VFSLSLLSKLLYNIQHVINDCHSRDILRTALQGIVSSFCKLKETLSKINNSYVRVLQLSVREQAGYEKQFDESFFATEHNLQRRNRLLGITWGDLLVNEAFITRKAIEANLGVMLTEFQYSDLRYAHSCAENKYRENNAPAAILEQFLLPR